MLYRGGDDMTSFGMDCQSAVKGGVGAFSTAAGKNNFAKVSVDQLGDFGASDIHILCYIVSKRISARWISPLLGKKRKHRLDHFGCNSRRGVVIKIADGLAHVAAADVRRESLSAYIEDFIEFPQFRGALVHLAVSS